MSNELNEDELKIKIQQVEDKVKSLRKIEGDSDLSHRIEGLHAQFSYAYSQNPRFAGVVLKIGSHRTIQRKIIHFKNWERDLDEKCEWLAEKLDDRKSTRLNSSHHSISYAVFCLKKK